MRPRLSQDNRSPGHTTLARVYPLKELLQNQRAVMILISRRVNQSDRACLGFALEQIDRLVFLFELLLIALAELIPFLRIVPNPASHVRTRRDILQPQIDFGL